MISRIFSFKAVAQPGRGTHRRRKKSALAWTVLIALAGSGCASVKTLPTGSDGDDVRLRRPTQIYVQPLDVSHGMWKGTANEPGMREQVRDWLTGRLEMHLSEIAPTRLMPETPPPSGWLVTGRFLTVNPGSAVKRLFMGGVGAGASKLETRIEVFDLAVSTTEPILSFSTSGGSNLMAGVPGAMSSLDDDVDRTAREVRDYLEARLWAADGDQARPVAPAMDPIEIESNRRRQRR